jgi:hypothetical protein
MRGTIVITGFWYEQGGPGWLDLDGAFGNVVAYEDNISFPGASHSSLSADNFTGNLTIANSFLQNSYLALAGTTPANVLLLADTFYPRSVDALVQPPVIANSNTNPARWLFT